MHCIMHDACGEFFDLSMCGAHVPCVNHHACFWAQCTASGTKKDTVCLKVTHFLLPHAGILEGIRTAGCTMGEQTSHICMSAISWPATFQVVGGQLVCTPDTSVWSPVTVTVGLP